ncbi:pyrroline-5-carboxylate reductase [Fictibacillus iocasae]|uniref:Pyrroline-5-carboxylate reductase n=1 Tax=Fictibacillus iocasae TaxID=2715437 RepID=A0ABW2NQ52_9BACL
MKQTIGFIGCGKMAQAMIGGMLSSKLVAPQQIMASARSAKTLEYVKEKFNILTTENNVSVARESDVLFLAVQPYGHEEVLKEIAEHVKDKAVIVTIAAGVKMEKVQSFFSFDAKVVRTMPNTPSLVGAGMTAMSSNSHVTREELQNVITLFKSFGEVELLPESQIDAIPAISGSSPAYVYMFIEALADGGVRQGLSRSQSYRLAAQAVLGAAKMVLETGKHPGELKDQVTSPGGATIAAVATLEEEGMRSAVLKAMESCTNRAKELGGK